MDWKGNIYPPGTRVQVFIPGEKDQDGTLLTLYDPKNRTHIPRIMLKKNRRIVYGYECFWIPNVEAQEALKRAGKK